jgi:hypothetical protein
MAALISALQRSGAPHILQTTKTLPPPSFSESFFSPVPPRDHSTPPAQLHAHAHAHCAAGSYWTGPRCLISASPSCCPHKQPHQSDRGQSWCARRPSPLGQQQNLLQICVHLSASPTNSQLHRCCIVSAETEAKQAHSAGIFRCTGCIPPSWHSDQLRFTSADPAHL